MFDPPTRRLRRPHCTGSSTMGTAPRVDDHSRSHRIERNVPVTAQKIVITRHEARLVTPRPERPRSPVDIVKVLDVPPPQRLTLPAQSPQSQPGHQQMHGVGHQHLGMDRAPVGLTGAAKPPGIDSVIRLGVKTILAIVAALNDVLRQIGKIEPRFPCREQLPLLAIYWPSVCRRFVS